MEQHIGSELDMFGQPVNVEDEQARAAVRDEMEAIDLTGADEPADPEMAQAMKYAKLMARYRAELDRINEQHVRMKARLESRIKGLEFVYGHAVADWTRRYLDGRKERSIRLPWGTVGLRAMPARVSVLHPELVPDKFVKVVQVRKVDSAAIVSEFKRTGAVPTGCGLVEAHDKFYVQ